MENTDENRRAELRARYGAGGRRSPLAIKRAWRDAPKKSMSFKERLVMQFIICGFIVAAIMILSLVHINAVDSVLSGIKGEIVKNPSFDEFSGGISDGIARLSKIGDSVKTIFGFERQAGPDGFLSPPAQTELLPGLDGASSGLAEPTPITNEWDDFRIDEDILQEIYNREDLYDKNSD